MGETYNMQTLNVTGMKERITIKLSLRDTSPDDEDFEQKCCYFDATQNKWQIDEGERSTTDDAFFCYPNHLTTFAVLRMPTTYTKISLAKSFVTTFIIIFDAFIIIIALAGLLF